MIFLFVLAGFMLGIWLHECGHYIAARLVNLRPLRINFGDSNSLRVCSFSCSSTFSLNFHINPLAGSVIVAYQNMDNETDEMFLRRHSEDRRAFWLAFGGPFTNGCLSVGSLFAAFFTTGSLHVLLMVFALFNGVFVLGNINPHMEGSDGQRMLMHIVGLDRQRSICSRFRWLFIITDFVVEGVGYYNIYLLLSPFV